MAENIYKKLEIKDYGDIFEFLDEVTDRATLMGEDDTTLIFGDVDFIHDCVMYLVDPELFGYKIRFIDLYDDEYDGEYGISLERSNGVFFINAEPVRFYTPNDFKFLNGIKDFSSLSDYSRVFLNQYNIKQDLVEECLKRNDEVMLFGINEDYDDCCNQALHCGHQCPWHDEC